MADEKKKDLFDQKVLVLQAKDGFTLPVRYKGEWVRVTKDAPIQFETSLLPYEAKIEINAAVAAEHVAEAKMPEAPKAAPKAAAAAPQKKES
ncbi:MAG: hypothetical protein ACXVBW_00270 [Bdellovibrionota bacterium]